MPFWEPSPAPQFLSPPYTKRPLPSQPNLLPLGLPAWVRKVCLVFGGGGGWGEEEVVSREGVGLLLKIVQ